MPTLGEVECVCGDEAGCLGDTLYHQLTAKGINCVIVASTTILEPRGKRQVKTDRHDAALIIARSLAFGTYHAIPMPTDEGKAVKECIRMRDDHQKQLKQSKQELLSFCLRHGHRFTETRRYWKKAHMACLHSLELGGLLQETLAEYLATHESLKDKVERFDRRIEELSQGVRYRERVGRLCCFQGIRAFPF